MNSVLSTELGTYETGAVTIAISYVEETAADRNVRRLALLAEAREWRRIAEEITGIHANRWGYLCMWLSRAQATVDVVQVEAGPMRDGMLAKVLAEVPDGWVTIRCGDEPEDELQDEDENTLRAMLCLFFACECEDEANALSQSFRSFPKKKNADRVKRGRGR